MAKLTARGRTEVWRVERTTDSSTGGTLRVTLALMSDGNILKKMTSFTQQGKVAHSWGWTVWRKLKKDGNPDRLKERLVGEGYEEVKKR